VFLHYGLAALYFLIITLGIFFIFNRFYRRLMRHQAQPEPA
jgi:hypothetical protein